MGPSAGKRGLEPRIRHARPGLGVVADDEPFCRVVPPEVDLDVSIPGTSLGQPGVVGTILRVAVMSTDRERAGSAVREYKDERSKCQQPFNPTEALNMTSSFEEILSRSQLEPQTVGPGSMNGRFGRLHSMRKSPRIHIKPL